MKFYCEITSIGEESLLFLDDPNANFIIIFNNNAPAELAEFSVLHTPANYNADPAVGDTLIIGDKAFTITAIGDEALHTCGSSDTARFRSRAAIHPSAPAASCCKAMLLSSRTTSRWA